MIMALIFFIITYLFIGPRQIPRLQINRPAGALITVITIAIGILVLGIEVKPASGAEAFVMEKSGTQMTATIVPRDTHTASRAFNIVLVCDTEEARAKGLQGFRQLRANEAALFVFDTPEAVTFWMGSVAYPIDIVFISFDKKVVRTYPNCKPGSRDLYPSLEHVACVIETAAGSGIRVGDRVRIEGARGRGSGKKP